MERLRYLVQPGYNCVTLYFAEFVTLLGGTCTMADLAQFLLSTVLPLFTSGARQFKILLQDCYVDVAMATDIGL